MKKRYYNSTTHEWYTEGNSLTRRVNGALFSGVPSVEQLTDWGFIKVAELEAYDSSDAVNSFRVNVGNEAIDTWITPEQRSDYKNSIDAAELLGMTEVHPVLNGVPIVLDIRTAKTALARIQIYANQCYGVTEQHKAAINALKSVEAVEQYDFTTGYPTKLVFEV